MKIFKISFILAIYFLLDLTESSVINDYKFKESNYQPEQIHISYGYIPSQMIITWTTLNYINETYVEYGINNFNKSEKG